MSINIHEAKTHLSRLVERAAAGEEIIIAKAGRPMARLMPLKSLEPRRPLGGMEGLIWMSDDFDAPMDPEWLAMFYGEDKPIEDFGITR
ncbi:MAG: type II toxin-antitoxin system Phd/YefM family antitoxin [Chloroflexota bacterium]|nr:MAG: type II toxin-antitoxin system Phd/YefM family antitoxin [Chloroflexota bacterium]